MKRFLLYTVLGLGTLAGLTGCYEDQSTEASITIPEIEIDTVGFNAPWNDDFDRYTISVQQGDKLQLSFPVKQEGVSNPDYSYEWKLTMAPEQSGGAALNFMTISNDKDLEYEILQSPNSRPYILWYQVTDNATGIKKGMVWAIWIRAAYNEGLIVAETNDGANTDLAFIASEDFTKVHSGASIINHNLYTNNNEGQPIQGLVNGMLFYVRSISGQGNVNHIMTFGKDFYQHVDNGFKYAGRDAEVSYDTEQTFAPTQLEIFSSNMIVLVNEGRVYVIDDAKTPKMTVCIPERFTHPVTGLDSETLVDKYLAMRHDYKYIGSQTTSWCCWYDKNNDLFMYQQYMYPTYRNGCNTFPTFNNPVFDPNNAPGLDTRAAGLGYNNTLCFVMKNEITNQYQVYAFNSELPVTPEPVALYNIPESENNKLDQAISYYISDNGMIVYFATKNKVYAIQLDATVPVVKEIYSTNEEITHFSMFTQAFQLFKGPSQTIYYPEKCLDTHHNMLILGTWNGSKGTLQTLPIINPASGDIDNTKVNTYTDFGKIISVIHHE